MPPAAALFVTALVVAAMASGAWCVVEIWRHGRAASAPSWAVAVALACVIGGGGWLRYALVPPHHAMYLDEPWYAEAACALARTGEASLCTETWNGPVCTPYEKGLGWPLVLAGWARLAGCDTRLGIELNRILGTLSILLIAVAARCAGARWWQAVAAAALLALHPTHVAWSATGETNVPSALALLAGIAGALRLLDGGGPAAAALAITGLGTATAMRPESLVAAVIAGAVIAGAGDLPRRRRRGVAGAVVAVALLAALSGLPLWTMNASLSGGAFLSAGNIVPAIARLAGGAGLRVHAPVLLLAGVGAGLLARRRAAAAALLLATGIAMALVVLAYDRFDERMLLAATVLLLPLACCTGGRVAGRADAAIAGVAVVLAGALWSTPLRALSEVPETQVLETRVAVSAAAVPLPPGALLIAPHPSVLAASGLPPVMPLTEALGDDARLAGAVASPRPVYFLCDMFCEPGYPVGGAPCEGILRRFSLVPAIEVGLNTRTYGLYRVLPGRPGAAPPRCPDSRYHASVEPPR
ncbi:hypothetical protein KF840_12450 [bacterium]|nr:hypothetical protein [bacterium]